MSQEATLHVDFAKVTPEYAKRFPMEMAVLRLGGVYPGEKIEGFKNPYTGNDETEYFGNVGEHCVAVAHCAEVLATSVLGIDDPEAVKIARRGLVHDATKGFEIMRRNAVKAGLIEDAYSAKAYETIRPILEQQGIAADTIEYMINAGAETGHNSMASFVEIQDGNPTLKTKDKLPEMIVHLADDMTHTPIVKAGEVADTFYLTTPERMEAGDFSNKYGWMYKQGFGFDQEGKAVLIEDVAEKNPDLIHVKTYAEWQVWVAREISQHLVAKIDPDVPQESAEQYLKGLVNATLK